MYEEYVEKILEKKYTGKRKGKVVSLQHYFFLSLREPRERNLMNLIYKNISIFRMWIFISV